jgi:predicted DCC family thiol-disulfide oxidoreductase YuxK
MPASNPNPVILYDGLCGLCNRFVQFVLKRDAHDCFRFAALQGEFASAVLVRHNMNLDQLETMFVVLDHNLPHERLVSRSNAVIATFQKLGGFWRAVGGVLGLLPRPLRNWGYNWIARNRYGIFGKYDSCPLPDPRARQKFLDSPQLPMSNG